MGMGSLYEVRIRTLGLSRPSFNMQLLKQLWETADAKTAVQMVKYIEKMMNVSPRSSFELEETIFLWQKIGFTPVMSAFLTLWVSMQLGETIDAEKVARLKNHLRKEQMRRSILQREVKQNPVVAPIPADEGATYRHKIKSDSLNSLFVSNVKFWSQAYPEEWKLNQHYFNDIVESHRNELVPRYGNERATRLTGTRLLKFFSYFDQKVSKSPVFYL